MASCATGRSERGDLSEEEIVQYPYRQVPYPEDALPIAEAKREPVCPDPACRNEPGECENCRKRMRAYYQH